MNTANWWLGHSVQIACEWIDSVDWALHAVATGLTRQAVKASPPYDPDVFLDFAGEQSIYRHYGRDAYDPVSMPAKVA